MFNLQPVSFGAACPSCRSDALWLAWLHYQEGKTVPRHHIDCPSCGPCPCEHHEIEGVAA